MRPLRHSVGTVRSCLRGSSHRRILTVLGGLGLALGLAVGGRAATTTVSALQFNGTSQYVRFGTPAGPPPAGTSDGLNAATFTLETWFNRSGTGATTSTGTGGVTAAPLIAKGRAEAENTTQDMNYFLGIDATGKLAADFEEGAGQPSPGLNHPITGTTTITNGVWHHAAATYDGRIWRLYLDGKLDAKLDLGASIAPRSDSIQRTTLGSALTSPGTAGGFFAGTLDEARIWNVARTGAQIRASKNSEITGAQSGLLGRWGLEEGSGTTTADSSGNGNTGTLINAPTWVAGYTFPQDAILPGSPSGLAAAPGDNQAVLSWTAGSDNVAVAGYNVFRSTSPGVPTTAGTQLNVTDLIPIPPSTTLTFTDTTAVNGTTYYYVVVAVDTADNNSGSSNEVTVTPAPPPPVPNALQFNGTNQYATFGAAPGLNASTFTLETWFMRTGTGIGINTSAPTGGGLQSAVPLVTKGRGEADAADNRDLNYFLGIDTATNKLAADFEEGAGQPNPSLNHSLIGNTAITMNVWHHASASYDGQVWRIYLDGKLDGKLDLGSPIGPRSDSIQHAALASALTSTGVAGGFFQGTMDEARIWGVARTGAEIRTNKNLEVTSGTGLLGRWGMNEASGTTISDSAPPNENGTLMNAPTRVTGYTFPQDSTAPASPATLAATPGDNQVVLTWAASPDPDVAGYNVFRSTSPGVPTTAGTQLNGTDLVQGTTFTDTTAANGTLYYYVTVAVDSANNDSGPSNEESATPIGPTSVLLRSFTAARHGAEVVLRWRTGSEAGLLGFRVYRVRGAHLIPLNRVLKPAAATSTGHAYVLRTKLARAVVATRYRLQAVRLDGTRSWLGTARSS